MQINNTHELVASVRSIRVRKEINIKRFALDTWRGESAVEGRFLEPRVQWGSGAVQNSATSYRIS